MRNRGFKNKGANPKIEALKTELIGIFNSLHPLPPEIQHRIGHNFEFRVYPRKYCLAIPGEINHYVYIIIKGLARCFIMNGENNEITTRLMVEHSFLNPLYYDDLLDTPDMFIELLENCTVAQIHKDKLEFLKREFPEMIQVNHSLSAILAREAVCRTEITHLKTPASRLRYITEKFPLLLNRVPSKYIAAFMGISPETLSRTKERFYRERHR